MATLNVPGTYATIATALSAVRPGDTIAIASGYSGDESVVVSVDALTFDAPSDVTGIVLRKGAAVSTITLRGGSNIAVFGAADRDIITGNAGDNEFYGWEGHDTIDGGGGNDTIIVTDGGMDRLNGGTGNDTFRLAPFDSDGTGGSIDGGADIDTVWGDIDGYTFKNVEVLDIDSRVGPSITTTVGQLSSFSSIVDGKDSHKAFDIGLRGVGGTIDFSTRIAQGEHLSVYSSQLTSAVTLTGSAGGDYLTGTQFNDTIDGSDGNDWIDLQSYGFSATGNDALRGGKGNDLFDLGAGGAGSVDGGSDTDIVKSYDLDGFTFRNVEVLDTPGVYGTLAQIASFDRIVANDVKGPFQIDVSIRGKGGRIDFSKSITGADSVRLMEGGLSSGLKATGTKNADVFFSTRHSDTLDGGAGADTFYGGFRQTKADILKGGSGNDIFDLARGGRGSVDGGSGIDTVKIYDLDGLTFRNIEKFETKSLIGTARQISAIDHITDSTAAKTSFLISLEGNGGTVDFTHRVGGGDSVYVDAGKAKAGVSVTGSSNKDVLFGSDRGDTLKGGNGDDSLQGENGNDILVGGAGKDFLYGNSGADRLTGGTGADTFAFAGLDERGGIDHVRDFSAAQDTLRLSEGALPKESGHLANNAFKDLGVAGSVVDATDRILYDHRTGALSYDADGSGAKAAVQFAVLDNHALLTAHDFIV